MKKVLVTGATGFIGRTLLEFLHEADIDTVAAVRQDPKDFGTPGVAIRVVGDISADTEWSTVLNDVDAIVHLAARVHVLHDVTDDSYSAYRGTNVEGTSRLAEEAVRAGVRHFVFVSSIKVNGERTVDQPFTASDKPNPQDAYSRSKLQAEQAIRRICHINDIAWTIIRPPLVYGPGVGANFRRLLNLVHSGAPLPLASIANKRSLLFVENLCSLLIRVLESPASYNEIFLVSDGDDISTPELIRKLAAHLEVKPRLFSFPVTILRYLGTIMRKSVEIGRLCDSLRLDIRFTREQLGWSPPFSIDEGLQQTIVWYRSRR